MTGLDFLFRLQSTYFDDVSQFFHMLHKDHKTYLEADDFEELLQVSLLLRITIYVYKNNKFCVFKRRQELLNKRSELMAKFRHDNKFLHSNYKAND